jgi:hypothetical protein
MALVDVGGCEVSNVETYYVLTLVGTIGSPYVTEISKNGQLGI